MRFIAFRTEQGRSTLGVRVEDGLADLGAAGLAATLDELLRQGPAGLEAARQLAASGLHRRSLEGIHYLPPVAQPSKALAIGLNYLDHASESRIEPPKFPVVFPRFVSSWVGHGHALRRPVVSVQYDYEAELVAVIGRAGRCIPKDEALQFVAGYSIFNDGSLRDYQLRTSQWTLGKNFDGSGSFGPQFVTADELPPGAKGLRIDCRLNGQTVQSANTRDMVFDVATLVSTCSEAMELQPGDILITGTPSGVGAARKPPLWMKHGDVCEVEIEGLGVLRNTVVDDPR